MLRVRASENRAESQLAAARFPPSSCECAAGMGVGAMNELGEFGITHLVRQTAIGGYQNTGWDLVFDAIGCTVAALWVYRTDRARHRAPSPPVIASAHPSP